jgi:hypothetical protein
MPCSIWNQTLSEPSCLVSPCRVCHWVYRVFVRLRPVPSPAWVFGWSGSSKLSPCLPIGWKWRRGWLQGLGRRSLRIAVDWKICRHKGLRRGVASFERNGNINHCGGTLRQLPRFGLPTRGPSRFASCISGFIRCQCGLPNSRRDSPRRQTGDDHHEPTGARLLASSFSGRAGQVRSRSVSGNR